MALMFVLSDGFPDGNISGGDELMVALGEIQSHTSVIVHSFGFTDGHNVETLQVHLSERVAMDTRCQLMLCFFRASHCVVT